MKEYRWRLFQIVGAVNIKEQWFIEKCVCLEELQIRNHWCIISLARTQIKAIYIMYPIIVICLNIYIVPAMHNSKDTLYIRNTGGYYHGKLVFPKEFPFKPPSIYMITPNGRFKVDSKSVAIFLWEFQEYLFLIQYYKLQIKFNILSCKGFHFL